VRCASKCNNATIGLERGEAGQRVVRKSDQRKTSAIAECLLKCKQLAKAGFTAKYAMGRRRAFAISDLRFVIERQPTANREQVGFRQV
jgi:hypothetical protein